MKIIKRGTPPKERKWQGVCNYCKSEFESLEGELNHIQMDPKERTPMAMEQCEVCKGNFWLYPVKDKNER